MYTHAIEGLIWWVVSLLIIYGPWQWACTDAARQHLFALRDKLFDLAVTGRLDFASPEYRTIRAAFDQHIRFAHVLGWIRLATFSAAVRKQATRRNYIREAVENIADNSTREEVRRLVDEMNRTMALMLVGKSTLLTGLALAALSVTLLWRSAKGSHFNFRRFLADAKSFQLPESVLSLIHQEAAAYRM